MILSCSLLLLVLQATPPSSSDACPPGDERCKAKHFLKRAKEATTPRDRAVYTFGAHRLYLALFDKTGKDQDLCAARRAFEQSLAVKGQPRSLRKSFESQRADLTRREGPRGPRCVPGRAVKFEAASMAETPPKLMASDSTSPPPDAAPAPVTSPPVVSLATTPASATSSTDDLMPVVARAGVPPRRLEGPPQQPRRQPPPGRRLVIAGSVSLGFGLVTTGIAGFMGGHMINNWRESRRLHDGAGFYGTDAESKQDVALAKEYDRLRIPTITTAVIGGSTVIIGAVLVGVGAKRLARLTSRAAILPMPGGVAFRARF